MFLFNVYVYFYVCILYICIYIYILYIYFRLLAMYLAREVVAIIYIYCIIWREEEEEGGEGRGLRR